MSDKIDWRIPFVYLVAVCAVALMTGFALAHDAKRCAEGLGKAQERSFEADRALDSCNAAYAALTSECR